MVPAPLVLGGLIFEKFNFEGERFLSHSLEGSIHSGGNYTLRVLVLRGAKILAIKQKPIHLTTV